MHQNLVSSQPQNKSRGLFNKYADKKKVAPLLQEMNVNPAWMDRLIELRQNLHSPALGQFIDKLFDDKNIAQAFLHIPASTQYHHAEGGGLLAHSIEVAEIMYSLSYNNQDERHIATVAGLLHDIGKVRTLGVNHATTQIGKMVGHDQLTLEVCAEALKTLDKTWPEAANTLRHVWTCSTPGSRFGFQPNCSIAHKLRFADGESMRKYDANKLFKSRGKFYGLVWNELQQSYIWRPKTEIKPSVRRSVFCIPSNIR